jgi:hypothetical protein
LRRERKNVHDDNKNSSSNVFACSFTNRTAGLGRGVCGGGESAELRRECLYFYAGHAGEPDSSERGRHSHRAGQQPVWPATVCAAFRARNLRLGRDIFLQNEMPYDPPSQAAWMEAPGVNGWAAFKVANNVKNFKGYGMGSYSFFNQGINIYAANAFEVPTKLPAGSLNDLLTIFLNTDGAGGILNVVNGTGGSSTIANPDTPVTVVSYP